MQGYIENTENKKVLAVVYHTQLNNQIDPYITCNTTSLNTVLDYYGINLTDDQVTRLLDSPEALSYANKIKRSLGQWFIDLIKRHRQREAWLMIEWAANHIFSLYGVSKSAFFDGKMSINKIIQEINKGNPVICHLNKKVTGKPFGHYIVAIGYDLAKNEIIFHDPFGNWLEDYPKTSTGKYAAYPFARLEKYMSKDRSITFQQN